MIRKIPRLVLFIAFYVKELVTASLRIAADALTPAHRMRPAILRIPLEAKTDFEILILVNLISMTPGSICLDVSTDRRVLYIHAMYAADPDAVRHAIKSELERRVLELMR